LCGLPLLKREELDAEVAELVVERLPIGDEIIVGLRLLRRLEVGLRPLVNCDLGVLALGEALAILDDCSARGNGSRVGG
jgi:hypothetical protein